MDAETQKVAITALATVCAATVPAMIAALISVRQYRKAESNKVPASPPISVMVLMAERDEYKKLWLETIDTLQSCLDNREASGIQIESEDGMDAKIRELIEKKGRF